MISRFRIQNYKCFRDTELVLTPIHVLIGQNDCGKSSAFEAISAVCRSAEAETDISEVLPNWEGRELVYKRSEQPVCRFTIDFRPSYPDTNKRKLKYELALTFGAQQSFGPPQSVASVDDELVNDQSIRNDLKGVVPPNQTLISFGKKHQNHPQLGAFQKYSDSFPSVGFFRFEPKTMALPSPITTERNFEIEDDGFGLPTLLQDILEDNHEKFAELERAFRHYFPHFLRIKLTTVNAIVREGSRSGRRGQYAQGLGKQVHLVMKDGEIRLQQGSAGAILLFGFLALTHSPKPPGLILVEEPENGIYPKRLSEVVNLLKRFVTEHPKAPQIILTTHSPYLLSDFDPEQITFMCRQADGSVRARPLRDAPMIKERLGEDFAYLGELWYNYDEEVIFGDAQPQPSH